MRSSRTSDSRFLSTTSAVLAFAVGALGCNGDETCGPEGAPAVGIVASGTDVSLTFGNLVAGFNNDCPAADPPEGLISLTLQGGQVGTGMPFTLCIERPDQLNGTLALGVGGVVGSPVHVFDVTGEANGCMFRFDRDVPPTGTATGSGVCGNGGDPAGFALVLDGTVSLVRTCGATIDNVTVTLRGRVAVTPEP